MRPSSTEVEGPIGFIGLGAMGYPMARKIVEAGYRLRCYDSDIARGERLAAETNDSVEVRADISQLSECLIVICMLPDSRVVESVVIGEPGAGLGLVDVTPRGSLIIDCGSSDPTSTTRLGALLTAAGKSFVDAPVSGGVARAMTGDLTIMLGGSATDIERALPLLTHLGKNIITMGRLGTGHAMKALNNVVSAANFLAGLEAIGAGMRFGLDPRQMVDVLANSTGSSWSVTHDIGPNVLTGNFASGFAMRLMRKDIGIASSIFDAVGANAPFLHSLVALWLSSTEGLDPAADYTEIGRRFVQISKGTY